MCCVGGNEATDTQVFNKSAWVCVNRRGHEGAPRNPPPYARDPHDWAPQTQQTFASSHMCKPFMNIQCFLLFNTHSDHFTNSQECNKYCWLSQCSIWRDWEHRKGGEKKKMPANSLGDAEEEITALACLPCTTAQRFRRPVSISANVNVRHVGERERDVGINCENAFFND